jgi:predicted ATPase/DNA-binding winged helix-turn-helix (wHTH) protein
VADSDRTLLAFGRFRLSRARKSLMDGSAHVPLGSRALDVLTVLAERPGEVIPKEKLIALVWPDTVVEESSLRGHVAAVRKALGDGKDGARFVINIPGRGYSFVAPVRQVAACDVVEAPTEADASTDIETRSELPGRLARMIGRDTASALVKQNLAERRFVTLVGPGGIGKTSLAIEIASSLASSFADGVVFVDLAQVENAADAPAAISARLGVAHRVVDAEPVLGTLLRRKHLLLVLDNCEHVSQVVAPLIQRQLLVSPNLVVLATSREPLGVVSETLYRLNGLDLPPAGSSLTRDEAMRYESVQLFVQRARASSGNFPLSDREAPLVGDICRWLGGNPLAIELLAARTDLYGVDELAATLDCRLLQSPQARRTVLPRHRTLATMLDWSYGLLSPSEQTILRRLAVFKTSFSLDAARQVLVDDVITQSEVVSTILKLAAKSLVLSDVRSGVARYELAGLTRAYAYEKFLESDDSADTRDRHARYMLEVLNQSQVSWLTAEKVEWMSTYGSLIDEIYSAIEFALDRPRHRDLGIDLLAAGMMLGVRFSRLDEFEVFTRKALNAVEGFAPDRDREMRLRAILIYMLHSQHAASDWLTEEVAKAKKLGVDQAGTWMQMDTQVLQYIRSWAGGDYADMVNRSQQFSRIAQASDDPVATLVACRVQAQASHFSGDHDTARIACERVMSNRVRRGPLKSITGTTDFRISMRIILARVHWMQGRAELAAAVADEAIEFAKFDEPQSLCLTLAFAACPIALWSGDLPKARRLVDLLREQAADHALRGVWLPWGQALGELLDHRDDGRLGAASSQFVQSASQHGLLLVDHLLTIEPELARLEEAGPQRGLETSWCAPELQRLAGDRLLRMSSGPSVELEAEACFQAAIDLARKQNAVAWELRAATSLAQLWQRQSRDAVAYQLLSEVHERIPQGLGTADLIRARKVLTELGGALHAVG